MNRARIQTERFDVAAELATLHAANGGVGALCSFVGTVRDGSGSGSGNSRISQMELEHYPGMTERAIEHMIDAAHAKFDIIGARVVHRVGVLQPLEAIVFVGVASRHRGTGFQACEFIMDYLKTQAPFWKKEFTPQGAAWVDARETDDAALARWGLASSNGVASGGL